MTPCRGGGGDDGDGDDCDGDGEDGVILCSTWTASLSFQSVLESEVLVLILV